MTNSSQGRKADAPLTLRERNKRRTRREMLDAALKVFTEKGFTGATIEEIAAEAGASKVTLYAYFPSGRDDLFRELYDEVTVELLDLATSAHAEARGVVARVLALAGALLDIGARPLVGQFYSNSDPAVEPALAPVRGHASRVYAKLIAEDVTEARSAGHMEPGVEADTLALLLVGAMRAALAEVASDPNARDRLLEGIERLVAGLQGKSPR